MGRPYEIICLSKDFVEFVLLFNFSLNFHIGSNFCIQVSALVIILQVAPTLQEGEKQHQNSA